MTSKGQVTVPKEVRDELGLESGTKLMFIRVGPGDYRIRAKNRSIMDLRGVGRHEGPAITIEQMDEAIAAAVVEANR